VIAHPVQLGGQVPGYPFSQYWGPPAGGAHATRELRNWRAHGVAFVIFPHAVRSWFDYYEGLTTALESSGRRVVERPEFTAFEVAVHS
jgi:hypothetical protein